MAGLRRRRADGIVPFTVCSCDNILHNGDVARSAVVGLTRLMGDEDMAQWIADMVAFPNGEWSVEGKNYISSNNKIT